MAYPVRPVDMPASLRGQSNGRLDARVLTATAGQMRGPVVVLATPAARAWRAMTDAAMRAGHVLKISGPASAYRTYDEQVRIFLQRFTTTPVSSTRRVWQGKTWYLKPGMALAAVPGTSNHGWALAVDTGEESDNDTGTESLDGGTLRWLLDHEQTYGFSHEVQSEPWHLRYFAGDNIPQAVLDYESNQSPGDDDDMSQAAELQIAAILQTVARLEQRLTPREPFKVITSGEDIGKVDPSGEEVSDLWRWALEIVLWTREDAATEIAKAVVAALPPGEGGAPPLTTAEVEAACRSAINGELGFLKPGR